MASQKTTGSAAALIPENPTLDGLIEAAAGCRACPLWEKGTQTVFGEGRTGSLVMLVGEIPGDMEDREGHPFVGPAGRLLDQALEAAGIERGDAYVTNVVKHFKWVSKGKRRLHQKPSGPEIRACLPWLDAEIDLIRPRVIVALGATAAQTLFGRQVRVTKDSGKLIDTNRAPYAAVTVHPSSILRTRTSEERHAGIDRFVRDLEMVTKVLKG